MSRDAAGRVSREAAGRVSRALAWPVIALVRLYQTTLSKVTPRACRFHPTCSAYALGALGTHGVVRGGWLALRRVLRCHPWGGGGYDPVPGRLK